MKEIRTFKNKNAFLSNFYPVFVYYEGMRFPSVEHAFQAAKTNDLETRKLFMIAPTAKDAKRFGRQVKLRKDWDSVKVNVMEMLLRQKFARPALREQLLNTKDSILIEGNNHGDTFWGVCKGTGENYLGRLLMKIRQEIIEEESKVN